MAAAAVESANGAVYASGYSLLGSGKKEF